MTALKTKYENDSKREYRDSVWGTLLAGLSKEDVGKLNIAYLSGSSAEETLFLLDRGADPAKLHAIDSVPANVATINREVKAARGVSINTYGCELSKAVKKIRKMCLLDIVSLDFCGNISLNMLSEMESVLRSHVLVPEALVGVTYQKGREDRLMKKVIRSAGGRKDALELVLSGDRSSEFRLPFLVGEGEYQNGRTPMAWHSWRLSLTDECKTWSLKQVEFIKHKNSEGYNHFHTALFIPGKTASSVKRKYNYLGLVSGALGRTESWTYEEKTILIDGLKNGMTHEDIADKLRNKTGRAVSSKAFNMGLTSKYPKMNPRWSKEEDFVLVSGCEMGKRYRDISKDMPIRTTNAVAQRARDLGVLSVFRWTEDEVAILNRGCKMGISYSDISKNIPKRSENGVKAKAKNLGITNRRKP